MKENISVKKLCKKEKSISITADYASMPNGVIDENTPMTIQFRVKIKCNPSIDPSIFIREITMKEFRQFLKEAKNY